jgi:chromosomal replication initiation ATPase DnaA
VNNSAKNPFLHATAAQQIWGSVQHSIQSLVSPEQYTLWFSNIRPKALERDCLTLEVENDFCEVWLEKNYLDLIREKAMLVSGRPIKVKLEVGHPQPVSAAENPMRSVKEKTRDSNGRTRVQRRDPRCIVQSP